MSKRCAKCKTRLLWLAYHENGKFSPIEEKPSANGNLAIDRKRGIYRFATKEEIEKSRSGGGNLYITHFAKCKFAEIFRKSKKVNQI